jgi:hypothetical protein
MFCFKASVLLEELQNILQRLCQIKNSMENNKRGNLDLALSLDIPPSVSIMPLWNDQKNQSGIGTI